MSGLPWIKVWTVVGAHPKVQRLERELGLKDGLGVVIRLWCWTADYCPDGEIPESDGGSVAKAARGDSCRASNTAILDALSGSGLLDCTPTGYRVHDWHDMQTVHVETVEKQRAQARDRQARLRERRNVTVTRDVTRDVTLGDSVTVTQSNGTDKKEIRRREEEREKETTRSCPSFSPVLKQVVGSEARKLGTPDA